MSRQLWNNNDSGPGRGRDAGKIFGGTIALTTTPQDVQWIIPTSEIENFSIQLVWTGSAVTCTSVKIYTSNSFQPYEPDYQNESLALRAGNWVDSGTRWTTGFTAPAGGAAANGEICSQGKPVDACFIRIVIAGIATGSGTGTLQGFISGKAY
jgi:hypothetical protein